MKKKTGSAVRTIEVCQSIEVCQAVATFDEACDMLRRADTIVVGECACRKQMQAMGSGCENPVAACFMFGAMARYYLDHGLGRRIDYSEAQTILSEAQAAGLVIQPATAQNPGGLCNCCTCCCSVLQTLTRHPRPAEMVTANHTARVDPDLCCACETCTDRCPVGAAAITAEGVAAIHLQRCIGCGLCAAACPTGAIELVDRSVL